MKLFSCSAQLRLKFILLMNVKMPTVVGIFSSPARSAELLLSPRSSAFTCTSASHFRLKFLKLLYLDSH